MEFHITRMRTQPEPTCCTAPMAKRRTLRNTLQGVPDFHGDAHAVTVSATGKPEWVKCWKCLRCGREIER